MQGSQFFVRNNSSESLSESTNLDLFVVVDGKKWALIHFENDEVGTATSDPTGSGASVSSGSIGRVGGVLTAEFAGSYDAVDNVVIPAGPAAGQMEIAGGSLKLKGTKTDGTFNEVRAGDRLPRALRQYTDKLTEQDRSFRVVFPF